MIWIRALLLGAAGVLTGAALPAAAEPDLPPGFSQAKFESLLHQSFYLNSEQGVVILELADVQERESQAESPSPREGRRTQQFSITFVGPSRPALPAAIYRLEHRLAGNADLYLEPLGTDGSARRYRARFTVLR